MSNKDKEEPHWSNLLKNLLGFIMTIWGLWELYNKFGLETTFALYLLIYGMSTIYSSQNK